VVSREVRFLAMNFLDWLGIASSRRPLEVGVAAPDVVSLDDQGEEVRLAELCRDGYTLVYFYPKADTPGCTAQACSLRDDFEELQARGIRVVGVSADGHGEQRRFREKYRLPFILLADTKRRVAEAFGVPLVLGMARRQSFLVKDGRIVWRDLRASARQQARDVLAAVKKLG
jgi:peroxiredoxin Q/BCP